MQFFQPVATTKTEFARMTKRGKSALRLARQFYVWRKMKMNDKKITLKPCPYCGGLAYIDVFSTGTPYVNAHHDKKCMMKPDTWLLSAKSLKKQIKAWNRRIEND